MSVSRSRNVVKHQSSAVNSIQICCGYTSASSSSHHENLDFSHDIDCTRSSHFEKVVGTSLCRAADSQRWLSRAALITLCADYALASRPHFKIYTIHDRRRDSLCISGLDLLWRRRGLPCSVFLRGERQKLWLVIGRRSLPCGMHLGRERKEGGRHSWA